MNNRVLIENAASKLDVDIKRLFELAYAHGHGHSLPVPAECEYECWLEQTKDPFKYDIIVHSWVTQFCHQVLHGHYDMLEKLCV